ANDIRQKCRGQTVRNHHNEPENDQAPSKRGVSFAMNFHTPKLAFHEKKNSCKIKYAGATHKRLSSRSSKPPWPGSQRPESLTPARLLICDSNRSPKGEKIATTKAIARSCVNEKSGTIRWNSQARSAVPSRPPTAPSTVFLGEMDGQRAVLPNARPVI